jgi:hypothetical protein
MQVTAHACRLSPPLSGSLVLSAPHAERHDGAGDHCLGLRRKTGHLQPNEAFQVKAGQDRE